MGKEIKNGTEVIHTQNDVFLGKMDLYTDLCTLSTKKEWKNNPILW